MRDSYLNILLPLKQGVPYQTVSGVRVIFNDDESWGAYNPDTGEHSGDDALDIEAFYVEQGLWRTRHGHEVIAYEREGERDYCITLISYRGFLEGASSPIVSREGYEYISTNDEARLDLVEFIAPISNEELDNAKFFCEKVKSCEYEIPKDFPVAFNTGAHISTTDASLLAYFPTQGHWDRRVPQKIKAGRYLKKYFPNMSDDEIRRLSAKLGGTRRLEVYTKWRDMLDVYLALDENGIVSSCMSKDDWTPVHPLMVYHESDVVLVAMYDGDEVKARALVNKKTMQYPMIYGQWERMDVMLQSAGYSHGSLDGARINKLMCYAPRGTGMSDLEESVDSLRVEGDWHELLMPYIDGHRDLDRSVHNASSVNVHRDFVEIQQEGDYTANSYDSACISQTNKAVCECCGGRCDEDDGYYLEWEQLSVCDRCWTHDTVSVERWTSRGFHTEAVTHEYAYEHCIHVEDNDTWYMTSRCVSEAGYVWSDYHDAYIQLDAAVRVEDDYVLADSDVYVYNEETDECEWA